MDIITDSYWGTSFPTWNYGDFTSIDFGGKIAFRTEVIIIIIMNNNDNYRG